MFSKFLIPFSQDRFDAYANRQNATMLKIGMALMVPFTILLFGFSAYLGYLSYGSHRLLSSGIRTAGEVRHAEVRQHRSRHGSLSHIMTISYAFKDQLEQTVEGSVRREEAQPYTLKAGDRLEILYDAATPSKSSPLIGLERESKYDLGMSLLCLVFGIYGLLHFPKYWNWQKKHAAIPALPKLT